MFKLIQTCSTAKQAWDIKGDLSVKESKLKMLLSEFKNLRMEEDKYYIIF